MIDSPKEMREKLYRKKDIYDNEYADKNILNYFCTRKYIDGRVSVEHDNIYSDRKFCKIIENAILFRIIVIIVFFHKKNAQA